MFVLLCAGITKGIEGESSKLRDQGLREDNRHKPGTFPCVSSIIRFRSRKRSCFGAFLVYLGSRKSPREAIPTRCKYPTTVTSCKPHNPKVYKNKALNKILNNIDQGPRLRSTTRLRSLGLISFPPHHYLLWVHSPITLNLLFLNHHLIYY